MSKSQGHKIIEGLDNALAWAKGDGTAVRIIKFEAPTSIDVRAVRAGAKKARTKGTQKRKNRAAKLGLVAAPCGEPERRERLVAILN